MVKMVTIKTFFNRHEAGIAQGLLKDQGIESVILADDCGGMRPELKIGMNNVRLQVLEAAQEQAREILQILEADTSEDILEQIAKESQSVVAKEDVKIQTPEGIIIFVPLFIGLLFLAVYTFQATDDESNAFKYLNECDEAMSSKECRQHQEASEQ